MVRWRCVDLKQLILTRWNIAYHERTRAKLLRRLGFRHISARPRHLGQDPARIEEFKKLCRAGWRDHGEARRKDARRNLVSGRNAARPEKPAYPPLGAARHKAPSAHRPAHQIGLSIRCDLSATRYGRGSRHAACRYASDAAPSRRDRAQSGPKGHAVVVLDQAGWHTTGKLRVPKNLTLLPLPPKSPELNPAENVWQFLRQNKLSNRIFDSYQAILTAACDAWNSILADPARITSIGTRQWATIAHN